MFDIDNVKKYNYHHISDIAYSMKIILCFSNKRKLYRELFHKQMHHYELKTFSKLFHF